jgi:hypothetical protein
MCQPDTCTNPDCHANAAAAAHAFAESVPCTVAHFDGHGHPIPCPHPYTITNAYTVANAYTITNASDDDPAASTDY